MKAVQSYLDTSLKEIDDNEVDDPVYEYGLPSEEEAGLIGTVRNLYAPQRREVIKAPEEKQVPLEDLGMDSIPGETMTVKTPGEYGPVETDFSYAPIVRGAKSVLDYGKKLLFDKQTQEDTVEALKAAPAAAVEGGSKFLEDQMAAAMGMSAGYSSVNRPDGEVARFDPLAFTGAVAPAGMVAVSSAKAGETVLGIFGSTTGRNAQKRFSKFTEEVEKADDLEFDTPKEREEYLFQKSNGVFLDESNTPRFEIPTKDVDLLPYFKRRNLIEGTSDSYEIMPDPTMRTETVLADVLKFDELFKEYPALKSYRVETLSEEDILDGTLGIYSPSTTTLFVAPQKRKEFLSTLLHEVQHAVDDLEDLQFGSNPERFTTFSSERLGSERRNFFSFLTDKETSDSFDKYTPDELEILKSKEHRRLMPLSFSGLDFTEPMDEFRDLYKPIIAKMADWEKEKFDELVQLQKETYLDSQEAYRKYRGTPGEVDARNVQKRFLNPELQLTTLPSKTADTEKLFGLVDKRGDKVSSVSKNTDTMTADALGKGLRSTKSELRKLLDKLPETERALLPAQPDENRIFGYHGTAKARSRDEPFFDINFARKNDQFLGEGFYFTLDPDIASEYASLRSIGRNFEKTIKGDAARKILTGPNVQREFVGGLGKDVSVHVTPGGDYVTVGSIMKGKNIYGEDIAAGQQVGRFDLSDLQKPYVVRTEKQRKELKDKIPELKKQGYDSVLFADFKDRSKQIMVFPEHMEKIDTSAIAGRSTNVVKEADE